MGHTLKILTASALAGLALSAAADDSNATTFAIPTDAIVIAQQDIAEDYAARYAEKMLSDHDVLMPMLDKDGDHMCSREEFMQANERVFSAIDANGDGLLSETELSQAEQALNPTATN